MYFLLLWSTNRGPSDLKSITIILNHLVVDPHIGTRQGFGEVQSQNVDILPFVLHTTSNDSQFTLLSTFRESGIGRV